MELRTSSRSNDAMANRTSALSRDDRATGRRGPNDAGVTSSAACPLIAIRDIWSYRRGARSRHRRGHALGQQSTPALNTSRRNRIPLVRSSNRGAPDDRYGPGRAWRELATEAPRPPVAAADLYRPELEKDLRYPNSKLYPDIAATLARMAGLYERGGRSADFTSFIAQLRQEHGSRPLADEDTGRQEALNDTRSCHCP